MSKYCSVLLIGSTGMGKSALGKFLFNPSPEHIFHNQTITPAEKRVMQKECKVSIESRGIPEFTMNIVDTPGLNDTTAEADLKHMTEVLTEIQKLGQIQACILVVKFDSKIDAQYTATLEYYSQLLPDLFERNVFIVMTHFATDYQSEKRRELQGIDVTQVKNNVIAEVKRCSKITYDPMLFAIDSIPIEEEEMKTSLEARDAIIEYIYQLDKQPDVNNETQERSENVKTETSQEQERSHEDVKIKGATPNTELNKLKDDSIDKLTEHLKILKEELMDKDREDLVEAQCWRHTEKGSFWPSSREFEVTSKYEIKKVKTDNVTILKEEELQVKCKVARQFNKQLNASVTLYTTKQIKYKNEIDGLRQEIEKIEKKLEDIKKDHPHKEPAKEISQQE